MADGAAKHSGMRDPPDGGWGWMVVVSCFMVTVCTRAVTRCISIFLMEFQDHFGAAYSETAWIHSLVDCTTMLCAPVGSIIGNRWSCRVSVMLGGLLSSSGLLLSSFSPNLHFLYISMGLTGGGFALCYTPAISMVGCYFHQRRALAYGLAMSGSGIGTFVMAPVLTLLIECYSWRGALLMLSAFVANLCVCGALLRPITAREKQEGEEPGSGRTAPADAELPLELPKDPDLLLLPSPLPSTPRSSCCGPMGCRRLGFLSSTEYRFLLLPDFLVLALSFLLLAYGCSVPFVLLVPYALSAGLGHRHAAFLMSILGVNSIVGNITFGWLTDRRCLRPYRTVCYTFSVAMEGLCCLFLPLLHSFTLLLPFSVLYGYFDGAYVALIPVVTSEKVGVADLSSALGVVYFLHAIPYLLSPPIGGWLVDTTGSYTVTFLLSGAALLTSSLVLSTFAGIRCCRRRRHLATARNQVVAQPLPLAPDDQSTLPLSLK